MKHQTGKIKTEHHILGEFQKELKQIEQIPEIKRIIPGRISRQQKASSTKRISFSYFTQTGLKYNFSKGATAQEIFVICSEENKEMLKNEIAKIIDFLGK